MLYDRPARFLSPLLILAMLSGLLFAPPVVASPTAQSRSNRKATQARRRATPPARSKPRRTQQRRASADTATATTDQPESSEVIASANDGVRADLQIGRASCRERV